MKYAVISASGKQIKVQEGEVVELDNLGLPKGERIVFSDVFLYVEDSQVIIGKPKVLPCQVQGKVLDNIKGKKLLVLTFKAKSRYHKRKGYRSKLTKVLIEKITYGKN